MIHGLRILNLSKLVDCYPMISSDMTLRTKRRAINAHLLVRSSSQPSLEQNARANVKIAAAATPPNCRIERRV